MGTPFVKKYVEERDLTIFLVVDVSGSLSFGSRAILKRELSAEIAALLAFAALRNQDRVGAALVSDRLELFLEPRRRRTHVLRLVREILDRPAAGRDRPREGARRGAGDAQAPLGPLRDLGLPRLPLHPRPQGRRRPPRPDRGGDRRSARPGDPGGRPGGAARRRDRGDRPGQRQAPRPPPRRGAAARARRARRASPASSASTAWSCGRTGRTSTRCWRSSSSGGRGCGGDERDGSPAADSRRVRCAHQQRWTVRTAHPTAALLIGAFLAAAPPSPSPRPSPSP